MAQRGLVTRTPDPADGRKVITVISAAGRRTLEDRTQVVTDALARVLDEAFDADERRQIAAVLPLLERLADRL